MAQLVNSRYATALFDIAKEQDKVTDFEKEAITLVEILKAETDFIAALSHPSILQDEKIKLVMNVFEGRASDEFVGLMVTTIRKGRQSLIIEILEQFIEMAKVHRGLLLATVTSAIPLEKEQLAQIQKNIETSTKSEVELTTVVDSDILGGIIIRVGDKVVDGSIRGQLQSLKTNLNNLRLA
ncbi:MAG: ATP synthase F1 subunit delta [Epulopiscium sp. Nele67-Bin004]|nr:MAG: ATP synthase F1 subunit delta [Epulopiscium sp. Nele67-Bin004]